MAQQRISPEVIVKGFKKCCISNAMDGDDDDDDNGDMFWNDNDEGGGTARELGDRDTDW